MAVCPAHRDHFEKGSANIYPWDLPPASAEWTPHYWGMTASNLVAHHKFHCRQWCLKHKRNEHPWMRKAALVNSPPTITATSKWPVCISLPFCFCRKSIVLCKMVDLSILRGWPCPCSMVHSSLMSTLNWSRLFFSDLLRDALQQSTHENN